jgi:acetyl esterase
MQLLLALANRWRAPARPSQPVAEARQDFRRDALMVSGRPVSVGAVTDRRIDWGACAMAARHYAPDAGRTRPLLVYYHGGGFVHGDIDTHDAVCRRLCRHADLHVLSVDYRLAPEHPFPAAVDDAFAAFRWACANAAQLGALPDRVAVGGDSAGGNLAAVVAQRTKARGGPAPCAQMLLYPTLDRTTRRPSFELFGEGFLISRADIADHHLQYTGTMVPSRDPAQNPLCCDDLSGLAPALIVTAGFDPLRDEAEAYAVVLRGAGVPAVLRRFDGLLHGFASMAPICPVAEAAMREICAELRAILNPGMPATASS